MVVIEPDFQELLHVAGLAAAYLEHAETHDGFDDPTEWEIDAIQKVRDWVDALQHLGPEGEIKLATIALQTHGFDVTNQVFHAETQKILAVSTAHVTEETAQRLDADDIEGVTVFPKAGFGWWVHTTPHPDASAGIPQELRDAMNFAVGAGCDWLMLDRDATIIEELPHWEW
ncbi:hypothetical protein [Nitratireductor sp. OM-1]|uniref:DUF5983 family protein n=1 Tax=Nitratireductor sp. OM-1 TaxID=1756988 RepID=UPI0013AFCE65|nr:hypothetical protein [Nitratireductor sp. OM-1]